MADKILNTGLDALLGDVASPNKQTIKDIDLSQIKPNRFQPRQSFDEKKITELSLSIAKHGILSPILVRETGAGGYELIAGERRLRAAKEAGLLTAPCLIDAAEDQLSLELALIENLQREDLNPIEEARGYQRLIDEFKYDQEKVANFIGTINFFEATISNINNEVCALDLNSLGVVNTNCNNKMTINMYLNNECKDAMNLTDFVDKVKISLEDLEKLQEIYQQILVNLNQNF